MRKAMMAWMMLAGLVAWEAGQQAEPVRTAPVVRRGAVVQTTQGSTRNWQDVNTVPLNKRRGPRKFRLNNEFDRSFPPVRQLHQTDPVVQRQFRARPAAVFPIDPVINFAGLNLSDHGGGWPPDTTGDIGPAHYVQAVNTSIGIYNKFTGQLISATTFNDFFEGGSVAGTPCDEDNNGDPLVLYDQYAGRWFILDFAWDDSETDGSYYSVAVSKTADPTGEWWQYAMRADDTLMNDYPKAGIWQDGIYITANMFDFSAGTFQGVRIWALKKPDLYNGTLISQSVFDNSYYAWSILPANAKGAIPPPAGSPNCMFAFDADEWGYSPVDKLIMWKYAVDWDTPANTAWTGPSLLDPAAFLPMLTEIPQPGTARTLDSLGSRLMYPANYRNFGSHESVCLCQTVSAGGIAAPRWYEVRLAGGTPSIFQQGTYQPDSTHRWMGSVAGDHAGGIAVAYSASSGTVYPSIRYAGRQTSDAAGTLPLGETTGTAGGGSQSTYGRWGDYSTLSIDPADDATFWYTQEYYLENGLNWQTRILSFKLFPDGSGDVNIDGSVNGTDLELLARYLAGSVSSLADAGAADVTGDGRVNALDAEKLSRMIQ